MSNELLPIKAMNRHRRRLQQLIVVAEDVSTFDKCRHAAALYVGNRLIGLGVNQMKSHPLQAKFGRKDAIYIHAEIDAIRNALRRVSVDELQDAVLYVVRSKRSKPRMSRPCDGCMRAIVHFGIQTVYWTEEHGMDNVPDAEFSHSACG